MKPTERANDSTVAYYSEIRASKIDWLWYPYIPFGKITILQGDPGEGKTTLAVHIAATLSQGRPLPFSQQSLAPCTVIYQSAEDNPSDTIKPRLQANGADCARIAFIEDDVARLTLTDDRLENAIRKTEARLVILDPLQAFVPDDCDLFRAGDMREAMSRLSSVAAATNCAILIIGHMNKNSGTKHLYRGIGSIDIAAIARSVLLVGRPDDHSSLRIVAHLKSNLAACGNSIGFELDELNNLTWIELDEVYTASDLLSNRAFEESKQGYAERRLHEVLSDAAVGATEAFQAMVALGFTKRTVDRAKKELRVKSYQKDGKWFWRLP